MKKILGLSLMTLLLVVMLALSVNARGIIDSGECGDYGYGYSYYITWTLYDDGELVISGSGDMADWNWDGSPWYANRTNIKKVTIGNGVTSIGSYAFYGCDSLASVDIPDSVTSIGSNAFAYCDSLASITVDADNVAYSNDEFGVLFNKDKTELIQYPIGNSRDNYTIPNSVTSIGSYAFYGCTSLTSIDMPDSVTSIGGYAFYGCTSLTSIDIPDSVISIDVYAFDNCDSITSVTIGNGVTSIGWYAFYDCDSLASVTIGNCVESIGYAAFASCDSLTSIDIPDSVTSIGDYAFRNTSLTSVTIPDSVTSIGWYAFSDCDSLASVTIGNCVESICYAAFASCDSLTSIDIPDSVTYIGTSAFANCTSLASVTIGNCVESICDDAFASCDSLTSIDIPDSVTYIGDHAFSDCDSLTSIDIPDSVTYISYSAFYDCDSLTSVTIGNGVESIGNYAFAYCSNLTSAVIGGNGKTVIEPSAFYYCENLESVVLREGVDSIGDSAFVGCSKLKSINIPASVTSIGIGIGDFERITVDKNNEHYSNDEYGVLFNKNKTVLVWFPISSEIKSYTVPYGVISIGGYAFYGDSDLTCVYIPDSVTDIESNAFYSCYNLESVVLGRGLVSIGDGAFMYCANIISITIPDSVESIGDRAFYDCRRLVSVTIGHGVQTIGQEAFYGCSELKKLIIGSNVKSIGNDAFIYCNKLEKATIFADTVTFGYGVFWYAPETFYILGYPGSDVEAFAVENGYNFVALDPSVPVYGAEGTFTLRIVDSESFAPIKDANVSLEDQTAISDEEGKVTFFKPEEASVELKATVSNYAELNISNYSAYSKNGSDIIKMYSANTNAIIPKSCNGVSIGTSWANINVYADLFAEIEIGGTSPYRITKYLLKQGDTLLGESETGKFKIHNSAFEAFVPVTAYMETNGATYSETLNINVIAFRFALGEFPFGGETIKVPEDVMLFGGIELKFELSEKLDYEWEVTNNEIKVGLNLTAKEKDLSELESRLRTQMEKEGKAVSSEKCEFKLGGYAVIELGNNGVKNIKGQIIIAVSYGNGIGKTIYWHIPIRVEADFKFGGKITITAINYDVENAKLVFFETGYSVSGSVTVKGGVGNGFISAGAYGKGELTLKGDVFGEQGLNLTVDSLILHGEAGIYGKIKGFGETVIPIISGDLVLYEKDRAAVFSRLRSSLYNESSYSPVSRAYLETREGWHHWVISGTLLDSVSSFADPKVVAAGDIAVMIWVDDNGSEDQYNHQQLMYSVFDPVYNSWEEAKSVDTNSLNDVEYEIFSDGENIWVIYTQAKRAITANDDMTALASTLELVVAHYDSENRIFTDHTVITDNNTMDAFPNLTCVNGVLTAAWANNADNNLFGMSNNNTVYVCQYIDGAWSLPAAISHNVQAIVGMDAGMLNGALAISVLCDNDSDFATIDDNVLVLYSIDGDTGTLTFGGCEKSAFFAGCLYWYDTGSIYCIDSYGGEPVLISDKLGTDSSADFEIVSLYGRTYIMYRVYNTEGVNGGSDIYAVIVENDRASLPIRLTLTEGYVDSFGIVETVEGAIAVYRRTDATFTDGELSTKSDLCSDQLALAANLVIDDIFFDYTDLFGDDKIELTVSVCNNGARTANGFTVYYGDIVLGQYNGAIVAGQTVEIQVEHTLSSTVEEYSFTVVDDMGVSGSKTVRLRFVDFAVSAENKILGDIPYVSIDVTNPGSISATGELNVRVGDENGAVIYTESVSLDPGEIKNALIEIADSSIKCVYVEFVTDANELFTDNNYDICEILRSTNESADTVVSSGECGDNLTWILCEDGELVIEGEGDMWDWTGSSAAPWYSNSNHIKKVTVGSGVTSIGGDAFEFCTNLKKATIYSRTATYGTGVFNYTPSDFEIHGYIGSTAEAYAEANNHKFVPLSMIVQVGDKYYESLAEALAEANEGDTVKLATDCEESDVLVRKGVTLDLNGCTLTTEYLAVFNGNSIVDNSTSKSGLLVVDKNNLVLPKNNAQMPVYSAEEGGYRFATMKMTQYKIDSYGEDFVKIKFRPAFGTESVTNTMFSGLLADGGQRCDIEILIRVTWPKSDGTIGNASFVYNDDFVKETYVNGKTFTITITGLSVEAYGGLEAVFVVRSLSTNVEMASPIMYTYNP